MPCLLMWHLTDIGYTIVWCCKGKLCCRTMVQREGNRGWGFVIEWEGGSRPNTRRFMGHILADTDDWRAFGAWPNGMTNRSLRCLLPLPIQALT